MDKQNEQPVELWTILDIEEYANEYRQKKARIDEIEKVFKEQDSNGVLSRYIGKTIKVWYEVLGQKYSITGKLTNVTKGLAIICTSTKEDERFSINDVFPINLTDIVNLFATFDEKEVNTK
jgi:hypothetical protein